MSVLGLIVGDSISLDNRAGVAGWPTQIVIGRYVNDADSSKTLINYIEPNFQGFIDAAPDTLSYTIIQGGVNDAATGETLADMKTALTSIVTKAKAAALDVAVLSISPWAGAGTWSAPAQVITDGYNSWLSTEQTVQGFTFIDMYAPLEGAPDEINAAYDAGDHIHPNVAGHTVVAGLVNPIINSFFEGTTMADTKISALPAVTTPVGTDALVVAQGGVSKKVTRAQMNALESGEHLVLPQVDEAATPTLAFGDGDTGFYESADDTLVLARAGVNLWQIDSAYALKCAGSGEPGIVHETASATNPVFLPAQTDTDTGIGKDGVDSLVLIAGAQNCLEVKEVGSAAQVGFYATTPVAQQTGVAVSAAGIHAALVALGLITA